MLGSVLQVGNDVLIDDGHIKLRVEAVERGRARCAVIVGGVVSSHKGVNLPGVPLPIPSITRKDLDDLEFALELGVDFVALSFVRSASDVRALRTLIEARGSTARVIAKIEKAEAIAALDEILAESDAVMVARGDLGVEIGTADVPLLQKRIIIRALERGRPVITATQMLESMIHQTEPTRAEASDVANAILDGTSAIMLSGETAVGEYPIEAVEVMNQIACAVEPSLDYRHEIPHADDRPDDRAGDVECSLRHRRSARSQGDPRPDVHRQYRLRRRAAPSSEADHRRHAPLAFVAAHGARVGRDADRDRRDGRRRGPVEPRPRCRSRVRDRRRRRPGRDHGRNGREHSRVDERDQGRHRLSRRCSRGIRWSRSEPERCGERTRRRTTRRSRRRARLLIPVAVLTVMAFLYYRPLASYLETRSELGTRQAQVVALRAEKSRLERRLARTTSDAALAREARTDRLRQARRAALHRQGHRGLAAETARSEP